MFKRYLPVELARMIADYHDYDKYCKPSHKVNYSNVLSDIISMGEIMPENISPKIAWECWGNKASWEYDWNPEEEMVGLYEELDLFDV